MNIKAIEKKAAELVKEMTLEEKASLCSGEDFWHLKSIERLGIPRIMVTDGPNGLRKQTGAADHLGLNESVPATCFPAAAATACSFDDDLMEEIGEALGEEAAAEHVAVLLGPGANIKRSPLCGRNFEYISEDPYVTGRTASALIRGIQSRNVGVSLKHFACNSQESGRFICNSVVDERALHEIYLAGFEKAVKEAQPRTVMCAYNKVNGTYCSENKKLLTDILRDEWGFQGLVVTDWGAADDRIAGLLAGEDLEMPSSGGMNDKKIVEAVQNGTLSEDALDTAVTRIVRLILESIPAEMPSGRDDHSESAAPALTKYSMLERHHKLARRAAEESCVLVKNENDVLPVGKDTRVAVIGSFARTPRYQGAGSSKVNPTKLDNALDSMRDAGVSIVYAEGTGENLSFEDAVSAASSCDKAIVFAGLPENCEAEGHDRSSLDLPEEQNRLIEAVAAANPDTVVVVSCGAPVIMPWKDKVRGILLTYLPGQAGGSAIADILTGAAEPGGRLAETWPERLEDTPTAGNYPEKGRNALYKESIYVGYRYYDTAGIRPAYPFGFGLGYTDFAFSDLSVRGTDAEGKGSSMNSPVCRVSFRVKNTGRRKGCTVAQLYVRGPKKSIIPRPFQELRNYQRVTLDPGESCVVTMELERRDFAWYCTADGKFEVENGAYEIAIGTSSRDILLVGSLMIADGVRALRHYEPKLHMTEDEFAELFPEGLPLDVHHAGDPFTINTTIGELKENPIGKQIYDQMLPSLLGMMDQAEAEKLPLRFMVMMSGGKFSMQMVEGVLGMMNQKA